MEKTIEGWIASDLEGAHVFTNRPQRVQFGVSDKTLVGYEIDLQSALKSLLDEFSDDEPQEIKITFNIDKV